MKTREMISDIRKANLEAINTKARAQATLPEISLNNR